MRERGSQEMSSVIAAINMLKALRGMSHNLSGFQSHVVGANDFIAPFQ